MQIGGSHSLTPLRQPSTISKGQFDQRLVFLYPFIIEQALQKYADDLRDFMTVDFISEIKISNVLNITSTATQISGPVGSKPINPSQEVRKSLHYSYDGDYNSGYQFRDDQLIGQYQQKLDSFLQFIRNQLLHDPKYAQFNPRISSITLQENLINIPLIVGTKLFISQSYSIYWILLICLFKKIPLDTYSSISIIRNNYDLIKDNFYSFLFTDESKKAVVGTANKNVNVTILDKISQRIDRELNIKLGEFMVCLHPSKWEVETNHLSSTTNRVNSLTVPVIQSETQRMHFNKSMGSFQSYVSNTIMPLLHNMEYLLGPTPNHINFGLKISDFEYNSQDSLTNTFINLSNHVTGEFKAIFDAEGAFNNPLQTKFKDVQKKINIVKNICQMNVQTISEIKKILVDELDPNIRLPIRFSSDDIGKYVKTLAICSSKLERHSKVIEDSIRDTLSDVSPFNNSIKQIKDRFQQSIEAFIYGPDNDNALYDNRIEDRNNINYFKQRYQNFYYLINNNDDQNTRQRFTRMVYEIEAYIFKIMYFFYIWNFLSYLCSYIQDIDIDIKIQRRDALDFPNYCLTIPLDMLRLLNTVYTSKLFRQLISANKKNFEDILNRIDLERGRVTLDTSYALGMISFLKNRLKVPNIIVVDQHNERIYYQFMYMSSPNRVNLSALKSYVQHQTDMLQGF